MGNSLKASQKITCFNLSCKFPPLKYLSSIILNNNLKLTFLIHSGLLLYYITHRVDHYPTACLLPLNKNLKLGGEVREHCARGCCHIVRSLLVPG